MYNMLVAEGEAAEVVDMAVEAVAPAEAAATVGVVAREAVVGMVAELSGAATVALEGRGDEAASDRVIHRRTRFTTIPTLNRGILSLRFRKVPRPTSKCCSRWRKEPVDLLFTIPMTYSAVWSVSPKSKT